MWLFHVVLNLVVSVNRKTCELYDCTVGSLSILLALRNMEKMKKYWIIFIRELNLTVYWKTKH